MKKTKNKPDASRPQGWIATVLTFLVLAAALYLCFVALDSWAGRTFAEPILGSALLAVCDVALFALAVALAPPLSVIINKVLSRSR